MIDSLKEKVEYWTDLYLFLGPWVKKAAREAE